MSRFKKAIAEEWQPRIEGAQVEAVRSHGKNVFIDFSSGYTLYSHTNELQVQSEYQEILVEQLVEQVWNDSGTTGGIHFHHCSVVVPWLCSTPIPPAHREAARQVISTRALC
jgi:formamidopyrimidine-DNA glycosylase